MARNPAPVRPLRKHEREYYNDLRRATLDPLFRSLYSKLADVVALNQVYQALNDAVAEADNRGVPKALVRKALNKVEHYHKRRIIQTFQSALGIDIRRVLADPPVTTFLNAKIEENVALIKTIPTRLHKHFTETLQQELEGEAFDRQRLSALLRKEFNTSGYNLRRIARDQTTKTIGRLTEIRHRQMGVQGYRWNTSDDERVRPTHRDNEGKFFRWDTPPVITGHPGNDIQCRCVAIPVIDRKKPPPTESPASPGAEPEAPSAEFWNDREWRGSRTDREIHWQERAWQPGTPDYLLNAVANRPPLANVSYRPGTPHYSPSTNTIKQFGINNPSYDTEYADAVWRHEFGHAMDWGMTQTQQISLRQSFVAARARDRDFLAQFPNSFSPRRSALNQQAVGEIKELSDSARKDAVTAAMRSANLDEDQVRRFMNDRTLFTYSGDGALTVAERDATLWRFAKAWEDDDMQQILNLVSANRQNDYFSALGIGSSNATRYNKLLEFYDIEDNGVGKTLSDLMQATTNGEKVHLFGHWGNYYSQNPSYREAEIFANIVSILGSGDFGETLLRKIVPHLAEDAIAYLRSVG